MHLHCIGPLICSTAKLALSCDATGETCCSDGHVLNYTLPMTDSCKEKRNEDGRMVHTIPKLVPASPLNAATCWPQSGLGIPPGHRVCRFPGEFNLRPLICKTNEESISDICD